ncbi:MAG: archaetidylserine decarboxylase [Proteobacteria bacterium]|nr:archaetidylserine decarboxylase [Pseudomonadota bacterium]
MRPGPDDYQSFNSFFTRKLKPDARTWAKDPDHVLSPVDGNISQIGQINDDNIIQAKAMNYSLTRLLSNETRAVELLNNGLFATLYLSPRDYHRIHMPVSGKLIKSIYVPGNLFAVNTASVRTVDQLFARNERFISLFDTEIGLMAQIMVGAVFVGSMDTVWLGQITPTKHREITVQQYEENEVHLNQGDEFGHFNMGSTVILIFQKDSIAWLNEVKTENPVQVGQVLGKIKN